MILAVRYGDILDHLTVAYVAVYSCMCKPNCVCMPFIFPFRPLKSRTPT